MEVISELVQKYGVLAFGVIIIAVILSLVLKKRSKIPSVQGGWPYLGQVFTMVKGSPWDTMAKWVLEYGTIYTFHLFGTDSVCIADPDALKVVLATKLGSFKKDTEWTYKPFMVLLGNGLVTAEGHSWLTQRALMGAHLKKDVLEDVPDVSLAAVTRLSAKLDEARLGGKAIDMADEFRHMTLQVIADVLLSLLPEESDVTFATMYLPIVEEGNLRTWHPERMFLPIPAWFKFRSDVDKLNKYVEGLIDNRRMLRSLESSRGANGRKQDVLDKMLSSVEGEQWTENIMTQVRDGIKTFVLAGHETSASMLTWALYELSLPHNAELKQKVLDEAAAVLKGCKENGKIVRLPDRETLDGLVYTECCLKESLRKYSVVPTVVRVATQDVEVNEYFLKKGTTVMINIQGVHHNPAYWPEPHTYRPDRFLTAPAPFTFLPFIEGPRACLGQFLSLLESKIVLAVLISQYDFSVDNPSTAGVKHNYMIPIIPQTGHWMRVSLKKE